MVDPASGEIVHIDFGMAFEVGTRHLPIPEPIPFRLTRDMVSALGLQRTDNGIFGTGAHQYGCFRCTIFLDEALKRTNCFFCSERA